MKPHTFTLGEIQGVLHLVKNRVRTNERIPLSEADHALEWVSERFVQLTLQELKRQMPCEHEWEISSFVPRPATSKRICKLCGRKERLLWTKEEECPEK